MRISKKAAVILSMILLAFSVAAICYVAGWDNGFDICKALYEEEISERDASWRQKYAELQDQRIKYMEATIISMPEEKSFEMVSGDLEKWPEELENPNYEPAGMSNDNGGLELIDTFIATAYCDYGTTATGTITHAYEPGKPGTLAVNPEDIPYGTEVWLFLDDGTPVGNYICEDTGGNLLRQHFIVDIYMPSYNDCILWGAQHVSVYKEVGQ